MKYLLAILSLVFSFVPAVRSQSNDISLPPIELIKDTTLPVWRSSETQGRPGNEVLKYTDRHYPIEELRNRSPFSGSTDVLLISYTPTKAECLRQPRVIFSDRHNDTGVCKIQKACTDTLGYREVREILTLTDDQKDSLMYLLYNIEHTEGDYIMCGEHCPMHSIVFLNELHEKIAFIDMDFSCSTLRASDEKIKADELFKGKYKLIRYFFFNAGLKYCIY